MKIEIWTPPNDVLYNLSGLIWHLFYRLNAVIPFKSEKWKFFFVISGINWALYLYISFLVGMLCLLVVESVSKYPTECAKITFIFIVTVIYRPLLIPDGRRCVFFISITSHEQAQSNRDCHIFLFVLFHLFSFWIRTTHWCRNIILI